MGQLMDKLNQQTQKQTQDVSTISAPPDATEVEALWRRTEEVAKLPTGVFPSFGGGAGLYPKQLLGIPFVLVSAPVFKTQAGKFGEQEVAQAYICVFDDTWKLQPAEQATFTGAYLLNQLRSATPHELVGSYVWTIAPNPRFKRVDGKSPLMLKVYEAGDSPPDDDVWSGGEQHADGKPVVADAVTTRIQEIETAGAVPPPWETQATGPSGVAPKGRK